MFLISRVVQWTYYVSNIYNLNFFITILKSKNKINFIFDLPESIQILSFEPIINIKNYQRGNLHSFLGTKFLKSTACFITQLSLDSASFQGSIDTCS